MSISAARSHAGRVYDHNEDTVSMLPDQGLFLVADGMGGHASGEIASRIAAETLLDTGVRMPLADALVEAHRAVAAAADVDASRAGMGSTAVALRIEKGIAHIAWVGDSRGYLYRRGSLRRLTRDHSLVNLMLERGEITAADIDRHPQRHVVTQTLGHGSPVPSTVEARVRVGDRLLLCSDGLNDEIDDGQIAGVLSRTPDVEDAARQLIDVALAHGGRDNISVVVVDCTRDDMAVRSIDVGVCGDARWRPVILGAGAAATLVAVWWILHTMALI